jgi:hypothetical protein
MIIQLFLVRCDQCNRTNPGVNQVSQSIARENAKTDGWRILWDYERDSNGVPNPAEGAFMHDLCAACFNHPAIPRSQEGGEN